MPQMDSKSAVRGHMTFMAFKENERENKKNFIISAAERVFTKLPFDKVTMRNIVKEAGITAGAIYRYFPEKQTIYAEAYIRSNNRLLAKINETIDSKQEFLLDEITGIIIDHFIQEEQNLKMRIHFMIDDTLSHEISGIINESYKVLLDRIVDYFVHYYSSTKARRLGRMYIAFINGLLISLRKYPRNNRDRVIRQVKEDGLKLSEMLKAQIIHN